MKIKGAIFDMDGVLFDTERLYQQVWREIAAERGIELESSFLKAISGTNGRYMCQVIEEYYHVADGRDIMEECMARIKRKLSAYVPIKKGVPEILKFFQEKGIPIAVASSSSTQQIINNLKTAGLSDYFSVIVSGTEVSHGKPAPDIFLSAAKKIDVRPEACAVFEDSENGIKAGYAAGCITIMVPDLIEPSMAIRSYCKKICVDLLQAKQEIMDI